MNSIPLSGKSTVSHQQALDTQQQPSGRQPPHEKTNLSQNYSGPYPLSSQARDEVSDNRLSSSESRDSPLLLSGTRSSIDSQLYENSLEMFQSPAKLFSQNQTLSSQPQTQTLSSQPQTQTLPFVQNQNSQLSSSQNIQTFSQNPSQPLSQSNPVYSGLKANPMHPQEYDMDAPSSPLLLDTTQDEMDWWETPKTNPPSQFASLEQLKDWLIHHHLKLNASWQQVPSSDYHVICPKACGFKLVAKQTQQWQVLIWQDHACL